MKIDRPALVIGSILIALMMLPFVYHWDSNTNRGFTLGYYGQFNTVSNALARFNGVTIIRSWHNCDVTLEEFGFDVKTSENRLLKIYFGESTPVRKLTGDKLNAALAKKIQDALATQTNIRAQ